MARRSDPVIDKYHRMGEEADKQQTSHADRRSSNNSRASILVGASSIGAGLSVSAGGYLHLAAALTFLVAAAVGIFALRPRRGWGVDLYPLYDELYVTSIEQIEFRLLQLKLFTLQKDETSLLSEAAWVTRGFVALGVAILLLAAHAVAGIVPTSTGNLGELL